MSGKWGFSCNTALLDGNDGDLCQPKFMRLVEVWDSNIAYTELSRFRKRKISLNFLSYFTEVMIF